MQPELPAIIYKILARQGIVEPEQIVQFLTPSLSSLPHPEKLKGIAAAVDIICSALKKGSEIILWGDYDVDGTTGTSLLITFFRELGVEPLWHIPNRLTDGYGLNVESFKSVHDRISTPDFVLITIDCGISNVNEIEKIKELGGRVIVTDHHQLPIDSIPDCVIINPNQDGCAFKDCKLAGAGVAFYLAASLRTALEREGYFKDQAKPNMKDYLGFVALGTVADLVELTPVNRTLVRAGMEALCQPRIPGLESLMENAGLKNSLLTSEDISFSLGPKINAAGRLGAAEVAVKLLTCDNPVTGGKLSKELDVFNEKRKAICAENLETALRNIRENSLDTESAILVKGGFHPGVIGIVASKIIDIYGKPAIVFAEEENNGKVELKGSGRSIEGVHLLECLHSCAQFIKKYGGHAMAAGMTVLEDEYESFCRNFFQQVKLALLNREHISQINGNVVEASIDDVMHPENLKFYMKLEPFGPMNERPIFLDNEAAIVFCKCIGSNNEHLQIKVRGKYSNFSGVGFGLGHRYQEVKANPQRKLSFYPAVNRYRGSTEWQLRVVDL